jgi:hypothetical protein
MADFWAKVKRGNSRPLDVEVMSNTAPADGLAVPMATVPVNEGEAIGAFNVIAFVLAVMLALFATTVVVNVDTSAVFAFNANPGTVGAAAVPERSPAN